MCLTSYSTLEKLVKDCDAGKKRAEKVYTATHIDIGKKLKDFESAVSWDFLARNILLVSQKNLQGKKLDDLRTKLQAIRATENKRQEDIKKFEKKVSSFNKVVERGPPNDEEELASIQDRIVRRFEPYVLVYEKYLLASLLN
jgi:hypothetical protein